MNDFAADPDDALRHDIGRAEPRVYATRAEAASFSDEALAHPVALRGLETLALDELAQLRAAKPPRKPAAAIDPVASYIDWDLAVDGLSLAE
ncbi:hypothetical protein [Pseudoxanthomonas composti]|uniref:Uncharacterized protein n=1 Tax=Pseudoxanthomonas composti TaxID=2137479 RepID=A0A4Q1JSJ0_9GAMM|nr:hypothetical protein [Pseudoxanthomonas composti]RXR02694.1 hypothetical protein EPA99_14515 [Pseudoxanthomonas composti]